MDMMGGMGGGASAGGMATGGGMGMMDEMMAMGTSRMGGGSGSMISALPGFPGASHIYHVGATGFFLDHATHITLTPEQQRQLNQIKEQSLLDQATQQRKIDQAEQDLWNLTGADSPDAAKIEAKAREIAQLQAEQRTSFIRDVGKAAAVLADEQRKQLTGMAAPNPAPQGMPAGGAMPGMGGGGM
jgi:Spy/CpxP family protein refolding chaperone